METFTPQSFRDRCQALPVHSAYGQATRQLWGELMAKYVPSDLQSLFANYVLFGSGTGGHTMTALFEGDLFRFMAHADEDSRADLHNLCMFLWNGAPAGCFGSKERVAAWQEQDGLTGRNAAREEG